MRIGDIYKHKKEDIFIRINSFATHMGNSLSKKIVVFGTINKDNNNYMYMYPDLSGFGTQEEIENIYSLVISSDNVEKSKWEDIIETL